MHFIILCVKRGPIDVSFKCPKATALNQKGFEVSSCFVSFSFFFHRVLTTGHYSVRRKRLQGIPKLNIAGCTGKGNKSSRALSEGLNEWKTEAAQFFLCVIPLCTFFLSAVQSCSTGVVKVFCVFFLKGGLLFGIGSSEYRHTCRVNVYLQMCDIITFELQ